MQLAFAPELKAFREEAASWRQYVDMVELIMRTTGEAT